MTGTTHVVEIERNCGANASVGMNGNVSPLLNLPESARFVRKAYDQLSTMDARREFFRSGFLRIDRDTPGAWARLYWFLDLCRHEKWFWREQGYRTFEEFWVQQGKFAIGEIAKLEAMFSFAKIACPRMFDLGKAEAVALWRCSSHQLVRYQTNPDAGPRTKSTTGDTSKAVQAYLFPELDYDLQSEEYRRGFDHAHGGSNVVRRFRRLKKLAPGIAQEVLEGKFVRVVKGRPHPDLAAAEEKAGVSRQRTTAARNKRATRLAVTLSHLSRHDLNDLWAALDTSAKRHLRALVRTKSK